MKSILSKIICLLLIANISRAQEFKESVESLTTKAKKGFMYDVSKDDNGNTNITYKIKGDKKSDAALFEKYSFDKELKFLGASDVQEKKEQKEDREKTVLYANVGGSNSFNVLSMKLKLNKKVILKEWSHERQQYINKKLISNETIKAKNDEGKVYLGYASYVADHPDKNSEVFNIVKMESKDKNLADKFFVLMFNFELALKETPLELNGSYTLVYCQQMKSDDVVMVFAPNKGSADVSKYVYFQFDILGNLKNRVEFKSPSSALFITAAYEFTNNIYFFGTSSKTKETFEEKYSEYGPIFNPGAGAEDGNNLVDIKWRKHLNDKADNFHLLKFSGNLLAFVSSTPVNDFKSKFKTAPGDKGASSYKGKKFLVESFYVTPQEDYLVSGQLTGSVQLGINGKQEAYEDIVCFHFDKTGNLKAQYGIGKVNNDKKSEIFMMLQQFYPTADGKSLLWEILEVKGTKGYEGFLDAYQGVPTFYAQYFPRIVKIDLTNLSLGAIKTLGDEKYFLKRNFSSSHDKIENSITYIGHDDDWKKIWIGKMKIN